MAKIKVMIENDDGWSDWMKTIDDKYKIFCCDCGLSHELEFKTDENGDIMFKAQRNNRSTGQMRRQMRLRKENNQ